ncbi:MAG: IS3 family transposase [Alistipes finegoldii]
MARSTFYYHFRKSKQPDKYAREKESIIRLYHEHKGRYGYRRITVEMNKIGYAINHKTILKLMNICGIKSQVRLRKYCSYKGQIGRIAPNLLQRDFAAENRIRSGLLTLRNFRFAA